MDKMYSIRTYTYQFRSFTGYPDSRNAVKIGMTFVTRLQNVLYFSFHDLNVTLITPPLNTFDTIAIKANAVNSTM